MFGQGERKKLDDAGSCMAQGALNHRSRMVRLVMRRIGLMTLHGLPLMTLHGLPLMDLHRLAMMILRRLAQMIMTQGRIVG